MTEKLPIFVWVCPTHGPLRRTNTDIQTETWVCIRCGATCRCVKYVEAES